MVAWTSLKASHDAISIGNVWALWYRQKCQQQVDLNKVLCKYVLDETRTISTVDLTDSEYE